MDLALYLCRVDGAANVLGRNVVEHAHHARLRVNSDLRQVRGEHRRGDAIGRATATIDRLVGSAKVHRVRGDLLQRDMLLRRPLDPHLPILQLHVPGCRLQHLSRDSEELAARISRCRLHC